MLLDLFFDLAHEHVLNTEILRIKVLRNLILTATPLPALLLLQKQTAIRSPRQKKALYGVPVVHVL